MNKNNFINKLSFESKLSKKDCKNVLNKIYFLICDNLKKGQEISFYGFGKFFVRTRGERIIRNNIKNKSYLLPPKNIPVFKMAKSFKNIIN